MGEIPLLARDWLTHQQTAESEVKIKGHEKKCQCEGYINNEPNTGNRTKYDETNSKEELTKSCEDCCEEPDTKKFKLDETCNKNTENTSCDPNISETSDKKESTNVIGERIGSDDNTICGSRGQGESHEKTGSETALQDVAKQENTVPINFPAVTQSSGVKAGDVNDCKSISNRADVPITAKSDMTFDCLEKYGKNLRQSLEDGDHSSDRLCVKVGQFLEPDWWDREKYMHYLLKEKDLKRFIIMDIVNPCSRKTCCFTKRYGHYIEGAGSLVQMTQDIQVLEQASHLKNEAVSTKNRDQWGEKEYSLLRGLGLRYFTPREIANILCFPQSFSFPSDLTSRQKYMLLGNSLNVSMVTVLLKILLAGDRQSTHHSV